MADPTEKKKGTWTTPVFWFLKGVEGFDTSRANDCAKKLNEKHYDTVAVLKLAEKRDLVEDAGILPGDALRIVVAARAYVAPCDPPPRPVKRYQKHPRPSSEPQHDAITTAVEHLQKAYQAACIATSASLTASRASDSAVPPQQSGASQSTSPKYESWGSDLSLRALPQQQPGAPALIFQAVPHQPRAPYSTANPPPGTSYSTFRASPQQKGAAESQQVAPKSEAVKDPIVPLPSTIQAFPQQPRASDSTFKTAPQQQEPRASDATLQAVPQQQQPGASHLIFQAVPQQHKGTAVSQQVAPKSEAVKDRTVPLLSTVQALPKEQPRASDSTFKAVPQQQQPGDSVPQQQPPKATNSTPLAVPQQQQARAPNLILQASIQASLRELHASFEACLQQLQQSRASDSTVQAIPQQQQQTGVSDSTSQAVPQQQKGTAVSQLVIPKSEAVKDPTVPLPSIIQAVPQQQQPPKATNSTLLAVPQQQQARASDPSILQVSLQASPQEQNASFQAYLQQLHQPRASDATLQALPQPGASDSVPQQQPPKASNSTLPANPQQPPRASSLTFQAVPEQQQAARASDPILQASLQAPLQEQNASFQAYIQQLHGAESEAVKNPTVPLPSTFQAVSQQQTRASNLTAQAVPQQQQPGSSPSTLQAVPKASDSTAQASPQQQPDASVLTSQTFPQQQARASDSTVPQQQPGDSDSTFQASPQQPRASDSTSQPFPQQQPRASNSNSQAVSQQQDPLGDYHPPRAPISAFQAPPQQQKKAYGEYCTGFGSSQLDDCRYHGSSQKDSYSGPFGRMSVKPSHLIEYPHVCRLCNVKCIGENQYNTHYSCQRHYEALDLWEARHPLQAAAQPHSEHPPSRTRDGTCEHVCGVCDIWCRSEVDLRSHFNGNKHAKNMKLAVDSGDNRHTTYLYCSICDVVCNSKWNLVQHLNGKRHAQNMEEDSDEDYSEGSSYYSEYS